VSVRRVLVVDSDPGVVEAARAALPTERYEVVPADSAASALVSIREGRIDALASELELPDGSGLHLLVEARLRHPQVPRIVVTALEDFTAAVDAINEAEVFRFLRKPLAPSALRLAVDDALGRAEVLSEAKGVRESAERRRRALVDLETDFPGISMVSLGPEGYFIPPQRLRGLRARLEGTRLGEVLAAALQHPGPEGYWS
jgi:DNA-binding NtrC family response regulator